MTSESQAAASQPSLRDRHAAVTRRSILEAARRLFREQGFAATSIRVLAEEAGVAVQTIYSTFGSKAGLASALNDLLDEESGIREIAPRIFGGTDPSEMIRLLARMQRQIWERCSDLIRVGRQSALAGDEGRDLWEGGQARHRAGMARIGARLGELGALRPGLDPARAGVELSSISNPDTFENFVEHGGGSFDDLEQWLERLFSTVLDPSRLDPPPAKRRRGHR